MAATSRLNNFCGIQREQIRRVAKIFVVYVYIIRIFFLYDSNELWHLINIRYYYIFLNAIAKKAIGIIHAFTGIDNQFFLELIPCIPNL